MLYVVWDQVIRDMRRRADMSQREFALAAGVSKSLVARVEADRGLPSVRALERMLLVGDCEMAVRVRKGEIPSPPPFAWARDAAGRHYPAHLDPRDVADGWWKTPYYMPGDPMPALTFDIVRPLRDRRREKGHVRPDLGGPAG